MALPNTSSEKLKQVAEAEEVEEEEQEVENPPCFIDGRLADAVNYRFGSISVDAESNIQLFNEPASSSSRSASTSVFTVVSSTMLLPVSCPNCSMPPGFTWSWPINVVRSSPTSPVVSSSPSEVVSVSMPAMLASSISPVVSSSISEGVSGSVSEVVSSSISPVVSSPTSPLSSPSSVVSTPTDPGMIEYDGEDGSSSTNPDAQPDYASGAPINLEDFSYTQWIPEQYIQTYDANTGYLNVHPSYWQQQPFIFAQSHYANRSMYPSAYPGYWQQQTFIFAQYHHANRAMYPSAYPGYWQQQPFIFAQYHHANRAMYPSAYPGYVPTYPVVSSSPSEMVSVSMAAMLTSSISSLVSSSISAGFSGSVSEVVSSSISPSSPISSVGSTPTDPVCNGMLENDSEDGFSSTNPDAQPDYASGAPVNVEDFSYTQWTPEQYIQTYDANTGYLNAYPSYRQQQPFIFAQSHYANRAMYPSAYPSYMQVPVLQPTQPLSLDQTPQPRPETAQEPRNNTFQNNLNEVDIPTSIEADEEVSLGSADNYVSEEEDREI